MKKTRKKLLCLLTALLFTCIMQADTAQAASSPTLSASADTGSAEKGGYVEVSVNLSNNPSISTLGAALNYDSSVLQYDSVSWNGGFSGSDMQMASDTGSEVNLSVVCDDSYSEDGTVATVRFKAVQDAPSVPVTLALRDIADSGLSAITCEVNGQVQVPQTPAEGDNTPVPEVPDTPSDGETGGEDVPVQQQEAAVSDTDTGSVQQSAVNAGTSGTQDTWDTESSGGQSTTEQSVELALASSTGTARLDQNYETGAGLGNDIFLIIAAACGILALVLAMRKHREGRQ